MSLTSYRAAPPRVMGGHFGLSRVALLEPEGAGGCLPVPLWSRPGGRRSGIGSIMKRQGVFPDWKAWRRPTLPRVGSQYHRRTGVSRPSSEWDRVVHPGCDHQAVRSGGRAALFSFWEVGPSGRLGRPCPDWDWDRPSGFVWSKAIVACVPWLVGTSGMVWARSWRGASSIERLGSVSSTHCCASTADLSTWWSSTALERDLVLRGVSRLDAFSGYPVRI